MFIAAVVEDIGSGALVNGMTLSRPPAAKLRHISILISSIRRENERRHYFMQGVGQSEGWKRRVVLAL